MGKDENGVNEEWVGKGKSGKKVREKELSQSEKGLVQWSAERRDE